MNIFETIANKFFTTNIRKPEIATAVEVPQTTITAKPEQMAGERVYDALDPFVMYNMGDSNLERDDLIKRWRQSVLYPEAANCVDMIVQEAINYDDNDELFKLDLSAIQDKYGDSGVILTEKIRNSYDKIYDLLNLDFNCENYFYQCYVDGSIYFECVYDKNDYKKGIIDIKTLSPLGLRKIIIKNPAIALQNDFLEPEEKELLTGDNKREDAYIPDQEYVFYVYENTYDDTNDYTSNTTKEYRFQTTDIISSKENKTVLDDEQVICASTGTYDHSRGMYVSYVNKATKALNQLYLIEDAIIIYRITHAPQKKQFFVDANGLQPTKAAEFLKKMMTNYKQKKYYNTATGTTDDRKVTQAYGEDYWFLKRPDGSLGTEVKLLEGTTMNLGELTDLYYWVDKVFNAFKIPKGRRGSDNNSYLSYDNTAASINRDELEFFKFIQKLRYKYLDIIYEALKRDLVSSKIIGIDDWVSIKRLIKIRFSNYNEYAKIRKQQLLMQQLTILSQIDPWREKGYYSKRYIETNVLELTDEEIETIKEQLEEENKKEEKKVEKETKKTTKEEKIPEFEPMSMDVGELKDESFPFEPNEPEKIEAPKEEMAKKESVITKISKDVLLEQMLEKYKPDMKEGSSLSIFGRKFCMRDGELLEIF